MNKRKLLLVVLGIALIAGFGIYLTSRQSDDTKQNDETAQTYVAASKKACDLLTSDIAKRFLGSDATRNTTMPASTQGSTEDVDVSYCMYDAGDGSTNTITLTVRGAHASSAGYGTNKFAFEDARLLAPGTGDSEQSSENIPALGDDAYYNPSTNQTNVLIRKGQYWLIIQAPDRDTERKVGQRILQKLDFYKE